MSNLDPALSIQQLHAERRGRRVLRAVDLNVARGQWLVLLGANGSGKSTLLDACVGRLAPSAGDARIDGACLRTQPLQARRALGYAVAGERLPALLSAREYLTVHAAAKGLNALDA